MKRTITLSLLLLIAGNGLMVTQAHASFLDTLKNKVSQYSTEIGICSVGAGLACLINACNQYFFKLPQTKNNLAFHNRSRDKRRATNMITGQDIENFPASAPIVLQNLQAGVSSAKKNTLISLGLSIPLIALGAYLLKKG